MGSSSELISPPPLAVNMQSGRVLAFEVSPKCLQSLLEQNIGLNAATIAASGGSAQCCELIWGQTPASSLGPAWASPDLVVAADVVYHRELFDPLLSSLGSLGRTRSASTIMLLQACLPKSALAAS